MNDVEKLIYEKNPQNIADFFSLDKIIEEEKLKGSIKNKKNIKIAILSSFTTKGIKEVLNVKCHQLGIIPEFYIAPYNQYIQEILNIDSGLYKFVADLIFIFIDIKSILGEHFYFPYRLSSTERKDLIDNIAKELNTALDFLCQHGKAKIVIHNFESPAYSPMGILENKMPFGFIESVQFLNNRLKDYFSENPKIFLFDYNTFCSIHGKRNICDPKMYYLADLKMSFPYMVLLCDEYLSYIKAQLNLSKKCLVLDLDNTLWGGILGEDGLEGIKLGPMDKGKPFLEFQKYILSLHERGIILAINSHNNYNDVNEVFEKHPYMILKEEHFASLKINWDDKVTNMIQLAKRINIGLDSIVYIDDDFRNRELIKSCLPQICVVDLPEDPSLYPQVLMGLNDFNTFQITDEDKLRGKMYASQRRREKLSTSCTNINDFLRKLETVVTVFEGPDAFLIPRIAQLTQRTNQFNMTTKRYQENEIKALANSKDFLVYAVKVEDKFGDSGIVGVAIIKKQDSDTWLIDSFSLSCRVLGRGVEKAFLSSVIKKAIRNNAKALLGIFIPSEKNVPAKGFYKENGFIQINKDEKMQIWKMSPIPACLEDVDFIKIIEKNKT